MLLKCKRRHDHLARSLGAPQPRPEKLICSRLPLRIHEEEAQRSGGRRCLTISETTGSIVTLRGRG
jgi:hypothetical protein